MHLGIFAGYKMHPRQFGNFHKVEDPSQKCADVSPDDHTGRHPRRKDNRCSIYVSVWDQEVQAHLTYSVEETVKTSLNNRACTKLNFSQLYT